MNSKDKKIKLVGVILELIDFMDEDDLSDIARVLERVIEKIVKRGQVRK